MLQLVFWTFALYIFLLLLIIWIFMWTLLFCQTHEEDSEDINQSLDNDPEQQGMSKDRVEMIKNFFINFTNIY